MFGFAHRRGLWPLLILSAVCATACSPTPDRDPPRLVLVYVTCSLNRHYIAPYDEHVTSTPNLAALARDGMVFDAHHTEAGASGIAFASVLTGGHAPHHQVFYHPSRIAPGIETLSEVFAVNGYRTYYWDAHPMAKHALGYGQGVPEEHAYGELLHGAHPEFVRILQSLEQNPDERAFVLHSNAVPHSPYASADEVIRWNLEQPELFETFAPRDVRRLLDLYRDHHIALQFNYEATVEKLGLMADEQQLMARILDVAYRIKVHELDTIFGGIWNAIEKAGLADDTLVVFTSDHGETLNRENAVFRWAHGLHLSSDVMQVPLVIRGGGVPAGRYAGVSRSTDLLPTVAGLAGLAVPGGLAGVDLSAALRGGAPPPELLALFHTEFNPTDAEATEVLAGSIYAVADKLFPGYSPESIWVGARTDDLLFKLRRLDGETWKLEAFDIRTDPSETVDRFDPENPRHLEVADALREYKALLVAAFHDFENEGIDDLSVEEEERLETLRSLGYIQ
jgi:arylsulfatase A-like enzyme